MEKDFGREESSGIFFLVLYIFIWVPYYGQHHLYSNHTVLFDVPLRCPCSQLWYLYCLIFHSFCAHIHDTCTIWFLTIISACTNICSSHYSLHLYCLMFLSISCAQYSYLYSLMLYIISTQTSYLCCLLIITVKIRFYSLKEK